MTKTINVDSVGEVVLARSRRAKRASISIKPFRGVRVAVPYRSSLKKAERFLYENIDWVIKNVEQLRQIEQQHRATLSNVQTVDRNLARRGAG